MSQLAETMNQGITDPQACERPPPPLTDPASDIGEDTGTTSKGKGKERLHEELPSEASWLPTLPSLSEVFSKPEDAHILAMIKESARNSNFEYGLQGQHLPNIRLPSDTRAPGQSTGHKHPGYIDLDRLRSFYASQQVPKPLARKGLGGRVPSNNASTSQQEPGPGLEEDSDCMILSGDESGTKEAPIDVETYYENFPRLQARVDPSNLSDADRAIYEDQASRCSNQQRALLQGEGYSNEQLLEKPGKACLKPDCQRMHLPWPTSGELIICSCMYRCELCGKFQRRAWLLKDHVQKFHVGPNFSIKEPEERKLWTSVRCEIQRLNRGNTDGPIRKRTPNPNGEETVISSRTRKEIKRSSEVFSNRYNWQDEVIRRVEAEEEAEDIQSTDQETRD